MASKILLVMGVTGAGKSTIISHLVAIDKNLCYIRALTNRFREGDVEKIYVGEEELRRLILADEALLVNEKYGFTYLTTKKAVVEALAAELTPVLDFPIQRLSEFKSLVKEPIFAVYVLPPNIITLKRRLASDAVRKKRTPEALAEIRDFNSGRYRGYDLKVVNHNGQAKKVAEQIYKAFLQSHSSSQ